MRARTAIVGLVLLLGAAAGAWRLLHPADGPVTWRTAAVERKDLRASVSATGTLDAVTTVEVGTQVTGVIAELLVDYNDTVTAGQVVARIDPALLEADVRTARADLAVARAQAHQALQDRERADRLLAQGAATAAEVEAAVSAHEVAAARVQASQVAVERATRNLSYATIASPIDGVVVERDVDVGQTVNAGMSAPRLFLIAGDLARMQILANVDEADIGRIFEGQEVDFTVQAWPEDHFAGTVRQVRLQSTVEENVVTYTVVVDVDNSAGKLLPGMTATVEFITEQVSDVLCVPTAALRFRPEEDQLDPAARAAWEERRKARDAGGEGPGASTGGGEKASAGGEQASNGGEKPGGEKPSGEKPGGEKPSGEKAGSGGEHGGGERGGGERGGREGRGRVFVVAESGLLSSLRVETGVSDGTCTQVSGEGITEGLEVVTGAQRSESGGRGSLLSPAGGGSSSSMGRPGGF